MQEIERRLMADFAIESMMGNSVDVTIVPKYSEDINLRMMQEQYAHWCVASSTWWSGVTRKSSDSRQRLKG